MSTAPLTRSESNPPCSLNDHPTAPPSVICARNLRKAMNEQSPCAVAKHPILGGVLSSLIGTVLAWLSSAVILPLTFGIVRKDSASLWGLSGVADLVIGFLCLPAFLLAHGLSYALLRNAETTSWRATRSVVQGMIFFWIVLLLVWHWQVGGPVTRGQ